MNTAFDFGDIRPLSYFLCIAVILGLLFALVAESELPLFLHILQWQLQAVPPVIILIAVQQGLQNVLLRSATRLSKGSSVVQLLLGGVIAAAVFSPVGLLLDILFNKEGWPSRWFATLLSEWAGIAPPLAVSWLAMNAPLVLGIRFQWGSEMPQADGPEPEKPASAAAHSLPAEKAGFWKLVADDKRGPLLFLKAELHYVQVVTENGSSLVLYNLCDAIDELDAALGMQVHRSYWVATGALAGLHRRGRQAELELTNGEAVPVSRRYVSEVEPWAAAQLART